MKTLLLVFLSVAVLSCSSTPTAPEVSYPDKATALINYINQVRANPPAYSKALQFDLSGMPSMAAMKENAILTSVARDRAVDMANNGYSDSTSPKNFNQSGIDYLLDRAGYTADDYTGNVHWCQTGTFGEVIQIGGGDDYITPEVVVKTICAQEKEGKIFGYLDNIRYQDIGIGIAKATQADKSVRWYYCIITAKRK